MAQFECISLDLNTSFQFIANQSNIFSIYCTKCPKIFRWKQTRKSLQLRSLPTIASDAMSFVHSIHFSQRIPNGLNHKNHKNDNVFDAVKNHYSQTQKNLLRNSNFHRSVLHNFCIENPASEFPENENSYSYRSHTQEMKQNRYPKNLVETKIRIQFERQQFEQQTEFKSVFCISRKQITTFGCCVRAHTTHSQQAAFRSRYVRAPYNLRLCELFHSQSTD